MRTEVIILDPLTPDSQAIARAAAVLRSGGLVAFPTETVYGLGANALDAKAVARVFAAKGRPAENPLIVHVADVAGARQFVAAWPPAADQLAARFWPGPLSLVLPKRATVPDIVTAGGPTVAVRLPASAVARALVQAAGVPIAAPSANPSGRISPTRAQHVLEALGGKIELVLDGGPTAGGLESTVLDLTVDPPRVLRPGLIAPSQISAALAEAIELSQATARPEPSRHPAIEEPPALAPLRSPGMVARHYAPSVPLECVSDNGTSRRRVEELLHAGQRVGWLTFCEPEHQDQPRLRAIVMSRKPEEYGSALYEALHALERCGVERIIVDMPPESEAWLAVHDRLRRASAE